jgi:pimeloyl-ACP methyl ester carboxylesterase
MLFFPSGADDETFWSFVRIHRMAATIEMQERLDAVHFDVESLLDTIKTPTLVVQKRGDRVCPFAIGQDVARRIVGARFFPLEGDAHFPGVDDWRPMADAILDFLVDERNAGGLKTLPRPAKVAPRAAAHRRRISVVS